MKKENFINIVNAITGREFNLPNVDFIEKDSEYSLSVKNVYNDEDRFGFVFKTGKNEETFLKTFITQFCNKYKEPNPKSYSGKYGRSWDEMTKEDKAFAYHHHTSHMYNKKELIEQVKGNVEKSSITDTYLKYGFYPTLYGIGIFIIFGTESEMKATLKLKQFLNNKEIPFSNEFSDAGWVYRFKLNVNKEYHYSIINQFNKTL